MKKGNLLIGIDDGKVLLDQSWNVAAAENLVSGIIVENLMLRDLKKSSKSVKGIGNNCVQNEVEFQAFFRTTYVEH